MSNSNDWITARIAETWKLHPSVPPAIAARIGQLLNGELSERPLPQKELAQLAKGLISEMAPPAPDTKSQ